MDVISPKIHMQSRCKDQAQQPALPPPDGVVCTGMVEKASQTGAMEPNACLDLGSFLDEEKLDQLREERGIDRSVAGLGFAGLDLGLKT